MKKEIISERMGALKTTNSPDFLVIGAGPNGLYAADKLRQTFPGRSLMVFEQGNVASTCFEMPNVRWHSEMSELKLSLFMNSHIPDDYRPTSAELGRYYQEFALDRGLNVATGVRVSRIRRVAETAQNRNMLLVADLVSEAGGVKLPSVRARYIILCSGVFGNPRKIAQLREGEYTTRLDTSLKGKRLALVGSGNSAADAVIHLLPHNEIFWLTRGQPKRLFPSVAESFASVVESNKSRLTTLTGVEVVGVGPEKSLSLSNGKVLKEIDEVIALTGFHSVSSLAQKSGFELEGECLRTTDSFETSVRGVFAFGSIMARWDEKSNKSEPTYVHNGNPEKFEVIVDEILVRSQRAIFPGMEFPLANSVRKKPRIREAARKFLSRIFNPS